MPLSLKLDGLAKNNCHPQHGYQMAAGTYAHVQRLGLMFHGSKHSPISRRIIDAAVEVVSDAPRQLSTC